MWFDELPRTPDWSKAVRHLKKDPVLKKIITRVGPCTLAPRGQPFTSLCKAIFSQQLSTKVAATLFSRFCDLFPAKKPTPARVLKLLGANPECFRPCGLSGQKQKYIHDLAHRFSTRQIPCAKFDQMTDEQVIESLTQIHGVGRWTAEMFLIFVMNRPDLLPVDDFGLRRGAMLFYNLKEMPTKSQLTQLAEPWSPYRSIATWYLWRGQDDKPLTPKPSKPKKKK